MLSTLIDTRRQREQLDFRRAASREEQGNELAQAGQEDAVFAVYATPEGRPFGDGGAVEKDGDAGSGGVRLHLVYERPDGGDVVADLADEADVRDRHAALAGPALVEHLDVLDSVLGCALGVLPKTALVAFFGGAVVSAVSGDGVWTSAILAGTAVVWLGLMLGVRELVKRRERAAGAADE